MTEPLFEITPTPVVVGSKVIVQTIWGDETGTVVAVQPDKHDGFPLATVDLERGDRVTVNLARLTRG